MKKRYAIVRVDMREQRDGHYYDCPEHFEKINSRFVCANHYGKNYFPFETCEHCRYGDTKEQLIKKVLTAIHTLTSNLNRGDTTFISHETMARRIVEFLGIKD